jgi:hypothetical protein
MDYIKKEIQFVNYVREPKKADVFILITYQTTGSGGTEYTMTFLGQNKFDGDNDTLKYNSKPSETEDETRNGIVQTLKLGLIYYVSKTPLGKNLEIGYQSSDDENQKIEDKWNNWVAELEASCFRREEEASNQTFFSSSINIDKVTEEFKLETSINFSYNERNYVIDEETNYKSITRYQSFYILGVKSLTDHWSAGLTTNTYSSTYSNIDLRTNFSPAIEYNLFKYSESTRKQLRFLYKIGYSYSNYVDTTIFNKMEEHLLFEKLSVAFSMNKKWGSISTSISGYNYLHDIKLNDFDLWAELRIRIFKGLSFQLSSYISIIHDQISLPLKDATSEEILLGKRILATDYSYYFNTGLTYTFGSLYNNIVNPRFGN